MKIIRTQNDNSLLTYLSEEYYLATEEIKKDINDYIIYRKFNNKLTHLIIDIYKSRLILKDNYTENIEGIINFLESKFVSKE